jgi:uncharacterized protein (TIGR02996 family)
VTEAEWIAFLQRPEIPAFNRAMLDNPDDDLPRLVFADWMEENCTNRRLVLLLRRSITHPDVVQPCPSFPAIGSQQAGLWRGRLVMDFVPRRWEPLRPRRDEMDFWKGVVDSTWLGRLSIWLQGSADQIATAPIVTTVRWNELEWLEVGGMIDWELATGVFVLSHPERFPKLSSLVHLGDTPLTGDLEGWLSASLVHRLKHFDIGYGRRRPAVLEAIRRSPHLPPELKARMLLPDAGA